MKNYTKGIAIKIKKNSNGFLSFRDKATKVANGKRKEGKGAKKQRKKLNF